LQPVLAVDRVRYVGEPIAVVIATDRYVAEDAAEMVFVDIEPLDAQLGDLDGIPIHEAGNLITTLFGQFGDVDAAIRDSPIVVEAELSIGRHTGVPMETRGIAVEYNPANQHLTIHGATKVPHWNRNAICELLSLPPSQLTMKETAVGGGFGVRGELYPEDVLAVWVASRLRRSMTWIEDRREHLMTANHSRDQRHLGVISGDETGRISAIASEFWVDMGAYVRTHSVRVADLTLSMLPGPYDIENYRAAAHCLTTNKTPTGTYRGPGRFESSFVRERLIDLFAEKVGMSPVEVRHVNLIQPSQIPYRRALSSTGEPVVFSEGDFPSLLNLAVDSLETGGIEQRRSQGEAVGVGFAMFLEKSGLGPWESGSVSVDSDGVVSVRSGCSSVGQGLRTALAQIVAHKLEIPVERVRVELLDTDRTEFGIGSYASRSTVTAGSALMEASQTIIDKVKRIAAAEFEVAESDLSYRSGAVEVNGSPEFRISIFEAAAKLTPTAFASYGMDTPGLHAESIFDVERVAYPCGVQGAVTSVDRETGAVTIEQLILCYDIGKSINPMLVKGQMEGGALQAVGGTLLESFAYDDQGNPLVTSFMDYLLPTMAETPQMTAVPVEMSETQTNPLGIKGAGEGGVPGVAAAIASAVGDAMGSPGVIRSLPVNPEVLLAGRISKT
ncbi:MAG: xanthine dehydrogenase family protein molybdopterin-binding subunit, partial [Acidimicrobiia bacterium]|nr:xanthine dehydrogenase family protein molybdopterin-binding subunit [Acidimicrobiia bacterium]